MYALMELLFLTVNALQMASGTAVKILNNTVLVLSVLKDVFAIKIQLHAVIQEEQEQIQHQQQHQAEEGVQQLKLDFALQDVYAQITK